MTKKLKILTDLFSIGTGLERLPSTDSDSFSSRSSSTSSISSTSTSSIVKSFSSAAQAPNNKLLANNNETILFDISIPPNVFYLIIIHTSFLSLPYTLAKLHLQDAWYA